MSVDLVLAAIIVVVVLLYAWSFATMRRAAWEARTIARKAIADHDEIVHAALKLLLAAQARDPEGSGFSATYAAQQWADAVERFASTLRRHHTEARQR